MTVSVSRLVQGWLFVVCGFLLMGSAASVTGGDGESKTKELYQAIESSVAQYQHGLDELRNGEFSAGWSQISEAIAALELAGTACAELAGCEVRRFMTAYHDLLTLRSEALAGAGEGFMEGDAEWEYAEEPMAIRQPPGDGSRVHLINGPGLAEFFEGNSLVRAALHEWLTWMRPTLIDAYENYMHMRHLMWPVYEEAGMPEALLFGILAKESGGRVHSVSRAGAAGPLQFMQQTGLRFGLGTEDGFDQRFDPQLSTRANVAYLRERFAEFDGDLALALAAYNGGETRVRRLARGASDPSFWNPEVFRRLPRETQEYVPYVLAAALLFQNPEKYGVSFQNVGPVTLPANEPAEISLLAPMTLSELAICVGQSGSRSGWFRTLRNLNPRHEHDVRLPAGSTVWIPATLANRYEQHCVDGAMLELARNLHASRDERRAILAVRTYVVRRGDTISTIAAEQGCPSSRAIAEANGVQGPRYLIRPGQELKLSGCSAS